jgi:twitching motility two-component system response regulator PilH
MSTRNNREEIPMGRTILIVDDSSTQRQHLEALLTGAGYTIKTAEDGAQALEIARRMKPHAILMDINMPEMDGFAATRALKADAETRHIPVVLVSSKGEKADKAWGQMLGAQGHIAKPYTDDEMLQQVAAL